MIQKFILIFSLPFLIGSCSYFSETQDKEAVARVNDKYLYKDELSGIVPENASPQDSLLLVNSYITRWATQQLLIDKAKVNLTQEKLGGFEKLVKEYKNDLLTEAYKNAIVSRQLDSVVTDIELREFYEANKENFKLNDLLLKVRYLQAPLDYLNLQEAKEYFTRFNKKDQAALKDMAIQFRSYNFNDTVWVKKDALITALPVIQNKMEQVLKKSNFSQLQDSLGVYLVKIENVLNPNDIAPLSFVRPTVEQIILNKRKLELTKKLETDITRDAIKNNEFEIYKNH